MRRDPRDETDLLPTPLRADPRPVSGLFQQVVVLARSVLLYDRMLDDCPRPLTAGPNTEVRQAIWERRELLRVQGLQGGSTLAERSAALTDHGRALAAEARRVLDGSAA
ncbi:hypothetical protein ACQEU8_20980 [Streptomyces sp. CA-250714]|uniref:hypothetical protein n=1 Tax=Streptomyces sp. CA-250714 TaxID=3240060 RepID=UPI003D8E0E8A